MKTSAGFLIILFSLGHQSIAKETTGCASTESGSGEIITAFFGCLGQFWKSAPSLKDSASLSSFKRTLAYYIENEKEEHENEFKLCTFKALGYDFSIGEEIKSIIDSLDEAVNCLGDAFTQENTEKCQLDARIALLQFIRDVLIAPIAAPFNEGIECLKDNDE